MDKNEPTMRIDEKSRTALFPRGRLGPGWGAPGLVRDAIPLPGVAGQVRSIRLHKFSSSVSVSTLSALAGLSTTQSTWLLVSGLRCADPNELVIGTTRRSALQDEFSCEILFNYAEKRVAASAFHSILRRSAARLIQLIGVITVCTRHSDGHGPN
jgi:hypothetical protein